VRVSSSVSRAARFSTERSSAAASFSFTASVSWYFFRRFAGVPSMAAFARSDSISWSSERWSCPPSSSYDCRDEARECGVEERPSFSCCSMSGRDSAEIARCCVDLSGELREPSKTRRLSQAARVFLRERVGGGSSLTP
jgi:hypothetical protein